MSLSSRSSQKSKFTKPQFFTQSGTLDEWYCNICTPYNSGHIDYMITGAAQYHERYSTEHAQNVTESELWWNPPAPDAAAWNTPILEDPPLSIEEMKMRESRLHVDLVYDMVPFWIRGVKAAEKGEVLRLEQFLETLQEASDSWAGSGSKDPWVHTNFGQEWGLDDTWGKPGEQADGWGHDDKGDPGWGSPNSVKAWGLANSGSSNKGSINGLPVHSGQRGPKVKEKSGRGIGPQKGRNFFGKKKKGADESRDAYDFVENIAKQQAVNEERKRQMHSFYNMPTHEKVKKINEVIRYLHAFRDE